MQKNKAICFIMAATLGAILSKNIEYKTNNLFKAEQSIENINIDRFKKIHEIEDLANEIKKQREEEKLKEEKLREEKEKILKNRIYCKFDVSFYTTAADEGSGTGLGASGEYVQPWVSVAMPSDIPFYSTVYIEGLGNFINYDTGNPYYINWSYDNEGNLVCRVDVCVNSKEEAFNLGRYYADGYIDINNN